MDTTTVILLVAGAAVYLVILILVIFSLNIAGENIFPGSGTPAAMAQMLLSSIHLTVQHFVGILVITVLGVLMATGIVKTEAALPILSAVAGYLLGRNFKDGNFIPSKKNNEE